MQSLDMFRELDSLKREIDEALRGAGLSRPLGSTFLAPMTTRRFPLVNIGEDNDNLYVDALVPGMNPSDIELSVVRNSLTLSGERPPFEEKEKQIVHRCELGSGRFSRTLELPVDINSDKISAKCKDGVLHIRLGKAEYAIPKKIEIKAA